MVMASRVAVPLLSTAHDGDTLRPWQGLSPTTHQHRTQQLCKKPPQLSPGCEGARPETAHLGARLYQEACAPKGIAVGGQAGQGRGEAQEDGPSSAPPARCSSRGPVMQSCH